MLHMPTSNTPLKSFALFNLGFRPFFIGATAYAALAMLAWAGLYLFNLPLPLPGLPAITWHAHELIYGYSMAVIAGFLLTAVRNWTNIQTLNGRPLALLFALWLIARIVPFLPIEGGLYLLAVLDLSFIVFLLIAVLMPIIRAQQWRQAGIASKLVLLGLGNACFYAGLFGWFDQGIRIGLYGGFYLIIALIITMGRRLIPFFTERGVADEVTLVNYRWLDITSLLLFLIFMIADVFFGARQLAAISAAVLFVLHCIRLGGWFTPGIWRRPLLWSLHAGYTFIVAGFALYAASVWFGLSPFPALHAFAVGGIGIITLSMMARVSLGHTGRNIHQPPAIVTPALLALILAGLLRVFPPLFNFGDYRLWIAASQILWMLAFAGFVFAYAPMLIKPRIDGQPG